MTANFLGFGLQNPFFALAVFQSVVHAVMKSGLFLTAGVIVELTKSRNLDDMGGLAKKFPSFAGSFLLLILAAAALPPFGAFFGEWIFLQNIMVLLKSVPLLTQGVFFFTIPVIALVSGLALYTMAKLFGMSMLGVPRTSFLETAKSPDRFLLFPIGFFAAISLLFGIFASPVLFFFQLGAGSVSQPALPDFIGKNASEALILLEGLLCVIFALLLFLRGFWGNKRERESATWNCGHPYSSRMEFTATVFSAPLRFFFKPLLWVQKTLVKTPIMESNPWIAHYVCTMTESSLWEVCFYTPARKFFFWISAQVSSRMQNGVVQFYLSLIFITLLVTLILAL